LNITKSPDTRRSRSTYRFFCSNNSTISAHYAQLTFPEPAVIETIVFAPLVVDDDVTPAPTRLREQHELLCQELLLQQRQYLDRSCYLKESS
jgi:hypothetical protein